MNVSVLQRRRSRLVSLVALLVSGEGGCNAILGLDPPTLASCVGDCPDATDFDATAAATKDATSNRVDGDATSPNEAALESAVSDVSVADASPGVPCGSDYCPLSATTELPKSTCCLTFDGGAPASYMCVTQANCSNRNTQYPIECASADDCTPGAPLCCFNNSAIKCEATKTTSPCKVVCDPSSGTGCDAGHACSGAVLPNGIMLPANYGVCSP